MANLPDSVHRLIELALEEDLGSGDVTTQALIDNVEGQARIKAKETCVVCGLGITRAVFEKLDPSVQFEALMEEGSLAESGSILAELRGPLAALLTGERTALNFLQRMCGVASLSGSFFERAAGKAIILDSRKTIPGWRWLDKLAVRTGGCSNHRMGLYDGILIKDNHISACGSITEAVKRARMNAPHGMSIEVEVDSLDSLTEALGAGAEIIMLDNFSAAQIADAVHVAGGKALLEVSGGITLDNLEEYIKSGEVDYISTGYMTHSATFKDISMEMM
ncbi:carboxylating nicotinate-nucleotide diphosphorylase [bacterium]|nr:MAG: carboxylating nicotinate-nucleotide diphosphorylase [bacterium]